MEQAEEHVPSAPQLEPTELPDTEKANRSHYWSYVQCSGEGAAMNPRSPMVSVCFPEHNFNNIMLFQ